MRANRSNNSVAPNEAAAAPRGTAPDRPGGGRLAAAIYGGVSALAGVAFLLVTTFTGDYTAVARYAGAVWVFLLTMIVLMPIVIPWVKRRRRSATVDACPLP